MASPPRKKKGATRAYAGRQGSMVPIAFEDALDSQLVEASNLLRKHWEKNRQTFQTLSERTRQLEVENLEFRQCATDMPGSEKNREALVRHQHQVSTKMLIQRDNEVRRAEAENRELRETLAALTMGTTEHSLQNGLNSLTHQAAVAPQIAVVSKFSPTAPALPGMPGTLQGMPGTRSESLGAFTPQIAVGSKLSPTPDLPMMPGMAGTVSEPLGVYRRLNRALERLEVVHPDRKPPDVGKDALYQGLQLDKMQLEDTQSAGIRDRQKADDGTDEEDDDDDDDDIIAKEVKALEEKINGKKQLKRKRTKVLDLKDKMKEMALASKNTHLYKDMGCFGKIVKDQRFDTVSTFLIVSNAIWLGIDCAWNTAETLADADIGFIIVENFYCLAFLAELVIRYGALQRTWYCFKDYWLLFDVFIVSVVTFDTWVMFSIMMATGTSVNVINPSIMRILRILRLTRVARIIRLLHYFPEVMVLLSGLAVAIRSVLACVSLLGITIYIFAIVFNQLTRGYPSNSEHFESLSTSLKTLTFRVCFYDGLNKLGGDLFQENAIHGCVLLVFLLLAPLTVMNMLIGVLAEVIRVVATTEHETMAMQAVAYTIQEVLPDPAVDGDRMVNQEQFVQLLNKDTTVNAFKEIGVDALELLDNPDIIFGKEQDLPFAEFLDAVLLLRGTNTVTVKDVMQLRRNLMSEINVALDERLLKQIKVLTQRCDVVTVRHSACSFSVLLGS
eukprot:TRINITY_DN4586_c0_g2_i2.p1 TRINITY_DN4586_c0_g2~~TRINITY_DN4586_c0_g2_i2.p1  ORF type:complete len:728 (-),score=133.08 TRINITY_DN4586_c0_g2_i2:249-2432(-)